MQIQTINPINFKADYYEFKKLGSFYLLNAIKTDDQPQDGKNLVLNITDYNNKEHCDFPMIYDGKYYTHKFEKVIIPKSYKILNKKNTEQKTLSLNPLDFVKDIRLYDRISSGKSTETAILKGTCEGIVITDKDNLPTDKPVIYVADKLSEKDDSIYEISELPVNVKGIIVNDADFGSLAHISSLLKQYFETVSIIYDNEKYQNIKSFNGKMISVSNESGILNYSKIENFSNVQDIKYEIPKIPILDETKEFLDFSELTRKNSGEKAYRLGVMQRLANEGTLTDITVPQGFVIPVGYINRIYEFINQTNNKDEIYNRTFDNPFIEEIYNKSKEIGIEENIILRSAFNAEDLSDYPSAGIYDSSLVINNDEIIHDINSIIESKDSISAVKSRQRFGIPNDIVQPTIIVQEWIAPDYSFTLYTKDNDDKFVIELQDKNVRYYFYADPARIVYDRKLNKINLEYAQNVKGEYLINNSGEVIEQHFDEDNIKSNWTKLLIPLAIIVKNALALEKYFGKPQDIEGGIKNGKVYFWQTRDIVKKVIKKI